MQQFDKCGQRILEQAESELQRTSEGMGDIARLYLRRHIQVHPDGWAADDDPTALRHFDMLVQLQPPGLP